MERPAQCGLFYACWILIGSQRYQVGTDQVSAKYSPLPESYLKDTFSYLLATFR